jgi:putative transposase
MMKVYKSLSRVFWKHHIWARGYFVTSPGNVSDEIITKYIEEQAKVPHYGVFKVND